jgi:hypothetical protein|tara:strand:+ start:9023 stop:9712 length:690 start_codon:yes stop_codon:yes gene_type:complete
MPTHFTNGVSNVISGNPLYEFGMLDPTKWHIFWDDFNHEPLSTEWTITATSAGAGTSAISTPDEAGGLARITTAADEDDGIFAQTIGEIFLLASGKKAFLKTRISVGDATQSDWVVGLHSTDTTPQDATMRWLFESVDGAATVYFNNDDNSTDTDSETIATVEDDTFLTLSAYYDGKTSILCYKNDVLVDTVTSITVPGAEMAVGFGYLNGAAGAETTDIDYIFVAKER